MLPINRSNALQYEAIGGYVFQAVHKNVVSPLRRQTFHPESSLCIVFRDIKEGMTFELRASRRDLRR